MGSSLVVAALYAFAAGEDPKQPPTGLWMGTLNIMIVQNLRLVVEVSTPTPGKLLATLDSPDQGAFGIPVDRFTAADSQMTFEIKALKASFEGRLEPDGKYHGTF